MIKILRKHQSFLKSQKGLTLVELILYIVLSGLILGVSSQLMLSQMNAFSFISARQTTVADIRYALSRISRELMLVKTADITSIAADDFQFVDSSSANTSFRSNNSGGVISLLRGSETLLPRIQSFDIKYYDEDDNELTLNSEIADIRRFAITITTAPVANEGSITLTTEVTPRNFLYDDYQ